jgi:hypothetical protein
MRFSSSSTAARGRSGSSSTGMSGSNSAGSAAPEGRTRMNRGQYTANPVLGSSVR